jgi:hypothetical protein
MSALRQRCTPAGELTEPPSVRIPRRSRFLARRAARHAWTGSSASKISSAPSNVASGFTTAAMTTVA